MSEKHTPEPWEVSRYLRSNGEAPQTPEDLIEILSESVRKSPGMELFGVAMEGSDQVVLCYTGNGPTSLENAYRIVACVNAMASIPDPQAHRKAVEELVEAADTALRLWRAKPIQHEYWYALKAALAPFRSGKP